MSLALRNSASISRLQSLRTRKAQLEQELGREQAHLSVSDAHVRQLKKLKLRLKEEIELLES